MSDTHRNRSIVCCFCGAFWSYVEGVSDRDALIKIATEHEATCASNPYTTKIAQLGLELAAVKAEAEKWEKLNDADTAHLVSKQQRDNYGPTETLNETAMRLSRELAEAQTTLQFAKKEYHALFREFSLLVKQRDALAEAMTKYMDHHMRYGFVTAVENHKVEQALAAVKGGEA